MRGTKRPALSKNSCALCASACATKAYLKFEAGETVVAPKLTSCPLMSFTAGASSATPATIATSSMSENLATMSTVPSPSGSAVGTASP